MNGPVYFSFLFLVLGLIQSLSGNLALSRALGDFQFKKNYSLGPQAQIITADPDVTCHEISEEDEFLVLACDGDLGFLITRTYYISSDCSVWPQVSGIA